MADQKHAGAKPEKKTGLSVGQEVPRKPVASPAFVEALRQAGARDSLLAAITAGDRHPSSKK